MKARINKALKSLYFSFCNIMLIAIFLSFVPNKAFSSPFYVFEAANYWGHEIQNIRNSKDPQECARLCDENPNCKVASFCDSTATGGWANTCVLRNKKGPRHTEQIGITSWVKP